MTTCPVCTKRPPRPGSQTCDACPRIITGHLREIRDLSPLLSAAITPGQGGVGPNVTGSREAPVPVALHVVDLAGEADDRTVSDHNLVPKIRVTDDIDVYVARYDGTEIRQELRRREVVTDEHGNPVMVARGDQIGAVSAASVLDAWVSDWIDHRGKGERRPVPTVPALAQWLLTRVDDACDTHPAIDEFAGEVWSLVCAVRAALQISRRPESLHAPCPSCEMLSLKRDPGSEWAECRGCGRMLSQDEYARLVAATAEVAKGEAA